MRESWLNAKNSEMQSFTGINCSVFGAPNLKCFFNAYDKCSSAIIDQTTTTIEGDPVYVIARINSNCNIDLTYDSTMDRYSDQDVRDYVCHSVVLKENHLEFNECRDNFSEESHGFSIEGNQHRDEMKIVGWGCCVSDND